MKTKMRQAQTDASFQPALSESALRLVKGGSDQKTQDQIGESNVLAGPITNPLG